jgi:hypothetical protein
MFYLQLSVRTQTNLIYQRRWSGKFVANWIKEHGAQNTVYEKLSTELKLFFKKWGNFKLRRFLMTGRNKLTTLQIQSQNRVLMDNDISVLTNYTSVSVASKNEKNGHYTVFTSSLYHSKNMKTKYIFCTNGPNESKEFSYSETTTKLNVFI